MNYQLILDNCIMAHQNATREPIVALIIDSQSYEVPAYSPKAVLIWGRK